MIVVVAFGLLILGTLWQWWVTVKLNPHTILLLYFFFRCVPTSCMSLQSCNWVILASTNSPSCFFLRRMSCTRACMNWSIQRTSRSSGETCTGLWTLLQLHLPLPRTPPKVITLSTYRSLFKSTNKLRTWWDWRPVYKLKCLSEGQTQKI